MKRARLIPESIFRSTHTQKRCARASTANKRSLFLVSRVDSPRRDWALCCRAAKNGARGECMRDTTAGSFVRAVIVLGAWASSRVISSLIVTFAWPSTCADMLFSAPPKPNYKIVADCKMHFSGVFPQMPHPLSPSLNPVNTDEAAASQTVCQRCPPMRHQLGWTWESHPRTNPGGFLCSVWLAWMQKVHRVLTSILLLQPCLSSSKIIITPKTCYLCRMMSQHMRKAAVLIGGRTKTVQSEHELMKGRIFCPRVFCLVPAEKRDTLCSASMLSAAITVYTAAWEPNPCAFWHGAPQCLPRSTNVWPGHQGNTTVTQEDQCIIFVGTRSTRALKESRCACMVGAEQLRALMLWVFAVVRPSEQSFTVASQIS